MTHRPSHIKDLSPGMKGLLMRCIVLERGTPISTSNGNITNFLVADGTGSVNLALYEDSASDLEISDIIEIQNGTTRIHKKQLHLGLSNRDKVKAGATSTLTCVDRFCMNFVEHPNMSLLSWSHDPNSINGWLPFAPQPWTIEKMPAEIQKMYMSKFKPAP